MATTGAFIGVDRHADTGISDLTGACRDATALWALFSDSLSDFDSVLLTDEDATTDAIRRTLDSTLGSAGPEDTVILSFSGHGTRDHKLVAHDTSVGDLSGSTIPMQELAARFKSSRARAVVCVLDCCFSGGAPARVLEHSPIPRDIGFSLESVAGTGRVLIAASNVDEPAYELPGTGHGLLTKALLDSLQEAQGATGLAALMDRVMERVRAEAGRLGVEQTPVLVGQIEGGLSLPMLRPGSRYKAAFPELRGHRVGADISELVSFGLPQPVLTEWADRLRGGLNDLQLQAVNDHRVLDGESLLVVAPTSSGKTFIGEMAATRAVVDGRKAVFLLPYRALVNEKYDQFSSLYGERLGMRVVRCTGDYRDQADAFIRGKYDLAVLTYEMFLNLAVGNPSLLNRIGLVVFDEAQFITDPGRGITVELLLTYLIAAKERGIMPQVVALSAVIGDINDFDSWLGCSRLITHERPVKLVEGVLDRSGTYLYLAEDGEAREEQLLPPWAIRQRRDKPSSQDVIVPLVRKLLADDVKAKVIVFRNQRGSAQGCGKYLAQDLGLSPASDVLEQLPQGDPSGASVALRSCLQGGVAFHTADLTRDERLAVERAFRDPEGEVRALAATTTVAAGINTPASAVILAEQQFVGEDGRPFTVAEYKNMAGRAGRLGFNQEGRAIILADNAYARRELFGRYVAGQLEPFRSSFDPGSLDTWVLRLLAQLDKVPRADVARLLANTYGGYLASRDDPAWRIRIVDRLEGLLVRMEGLGLLEQEGPDVRLTLLGRACGGSNLALGSAMRLVELLRSVGAMEFDARALMALVQVLPEADATYTPLMRRGTAEAVRPREAAARYGQDTIPLLQHYAGDQFAYLARCKRAAILWDWIAGTPMEEIERRYSPNPYQGTVGAGDVRRFADNTRFHLRSAHQIATILFVDHGPTEESVEELLRQLEAGIPAEALGLLDLPVLLERGEYLALFQVGARMPSDVWSLPNDEIVRIIGPFRSRQLQDVRPQESPEPTGWAGEDSK